MESANRSNNKYLMTHLENCLFIAEVPQIRDKLVQFLETIDCQVIEPENQITMQLLLTVAITNNSELKVQFLFPSSFRLGKVFEYIASHYNQILSLSDVAKAFDYSPSHLTHVVSKETGKSIQKWIIECRLTAAQILLLHTDRSIAQIAINVGYANPDHFSRQFQAYLGISPRLWRKLRLFK